MEFRTFGIVKLANAERPPITTTSSTKVKPLLLFFFMLDIFILYPNFVFYNFIINLNFVQVIYN